MPADVICKPDGRMLDIYKNMKYNLVLDDPIVKKRKRCLVWSKRISIWTLKLSLLVTFLLFVVGPFLYKYLYCVQRSLVFLNFVSWPKNPNYDNPSQYGVDGALNFYVTTDDDVRLGAWHVLPESLVSNKTEYTEEYFQRSLNSGQHIVIYNHGNSGHRVASHRVELYKLLRKRFHVICWDYRGYGDSSNVEPSESGLVSDAMYMYKWVSNRTNSKIFIWGHSLGTGVSTHMLGLLYKEPVKKPTGLVLESPFTNFMDEIAAHPFARIFKPLPWFHYTVIEPMIQNGLVFASDRHIIKVDCPILILHAEDDIVVPFDLGKKLYETAVDFRRDTQGNVTFVKFEKKLGYGHKDIYTAPNLGAIVDNFVTQSISEVDQKKLQ